MDIMALRSRKHFVAQIRSYLTILVVFVFILPVPCSWFGVHPSGDIIEPQFRVSVETAHAHETRRSDDVEKEKHPESKKELELRGYINIKDSISPLKLKQGDRFFVIYDKHGSVGVGAVYEIEDETVVNLIDDITWYRDPVKMKIPGMTGADSGSGCFIFRALKKGETKLTIWKTYRGEKSDFPPGTGQDPLLKSIIIVVE